MSSPTLLAVPNVSEGRSAETIAAIEDAFCGHARIPGAGAAQTQPESDLDVRLLDVHSDADHHRSVFTLAGHPGPVADAMLRGAAAAVERIDVMTRRRSDRERAGQHPHVGALDVAPIVYLDPSTRGAACAEALVLAERLAHELDVPVFLYGELTADETRPPRTRAELRRGGTQALATRIEEGLVPDFGPRRLHPTAGATLVAARPPLVAFNLQLAPGGTLEDARRIAARIREGGEHGLTGLRAIGVQLAGSVAQVSMNVERPFEVPLALVVETVRRHGEVASAELVGLVPAVAMEGFPEDLPMPGFDPARHLIENALGC